jgi:heme exporter protein C
MSALLRSFGRPGVLLFAALVTFPYALQRVFLHTPIESEMGTAQKIFYFHLPMAWGLMLFAMISGVAAALQLLRRSERAEDVAKAAGEVCALLGIGALMSGAIWGDATWGTPWTGDARLVTTALLELVFIAYLIVAKFGGPMAGRLAAALAVFGALDVPIIYYSVKIWKTTHPKAQVVQSLPPEMWASLWPCLFAILACSFALFELRLRQERVERRLDEAWLALSAGDAAPAEHTALSGRSA